MIEVLEKLLNKNEITKLEKLTYITFGANDVGKDLLNYWLDSIVMEEPPLNCNATMYAWYEGRRSCWRDIKFIVLKIEKLIKEELKDE